MTISLTFKLGGITNSRLLENKTAANLHPQVCTYRHSEIDRTRETLTQQVLKKKKNFPLHVTSFTLNSVKLAYHQCNNKMIYLKSSMMQKL